MYYLSQHTFVCPSNNEVVLLDLKHDRYMALDAKQAGLLGKFLQGWPASTDNETAHVSGNVDEAVSLALFMSERELLTTDRRLGKPASRPAVCPPSEGLFHKHACSPKIRIRHIAVLLGSAVLAAMSLRLRSIEHVTSNIVRRKSTRCQNPSSTDLDKTRKLVAIFYRLRPFMFRSNNACLFDSLTLINFLARFGVFPQWVFGVRTDPFAAHCWVQQDGTVFNDSVEHVTRYTPIMVA